MGKYSYTDTHYAAYVTQPYSSPSCDLVKLSVSSIRNTWPCTSTSPPNGKSSGENKAANTKTPITHAYHENATSAPVVSTRTIRMQTASLLTTPHVHPSAFLCVNRDKNLPPMMPLFRIAGS